MIHHKECLSKCKTCIGSSSNCTACNTISSHRIDNIQLLCHCEQSYYEVDGSCICNFLLKFRLLFFIFIWKKKKKINIFIHI